MIDVQRLRILREVAQHGSFSKAAAALLFTPSAVSQQIAALERTLGVTVVDRSTRGVVLTEPGRLLVEAADAITAELRHAQDRIDRLTSGRTRLTLATFGSGGRRLLPAALAAFVAAHPEVELTIVEHEPEGSLPLVREGKADLALAYHFDGPFGDRTGLTWTPLMADPMWIVLPAGHRLAGRASLELGELAAESWVLGCSKTEGYLRRYAGQAGFELRVLASTTDYFFAQALVEAGVGVSLIPEVALRADAARPADGAPVGSGTPAGRESGLVALPVEPPRPTRYLGVVTPARRTSAPAAALIEALQAGIGAAG